MESSLFEFDTCKFTNLISLQNGAAIVVENPTALSVFNFMNCDFLNILSLQNGGFIYIVSELSDKKNYPLLQITNCNANYLFAA